MRPGFSSTDIIKGVKTNDSKVLEFLYNEMRPQVLNYVTNNGGNSDEAEDVLQDGIIAFYNNVIDEKYIPRDNAKVTTYLFQICKFRWLENLKSARVRTSVQMKEEHSHLQVVEPEFYEEMETVGRQKQVADMFSKLGEKCRQLLLLFYYEKKSMVEINSIMGFSGNTSKNEKYRCMKKLRTLYAAE